MSAPSGPTIKQTEVVNTVLPVVATIVTLFRLFERVRQGRLWLDDAWAAFAMISNIILMVANWLYLHDFAKFSPTTNVGLYYMIAQFFYATIWASRISILFTVVRLTVPGPLRRTLLFVFAAFVVIWIILFAQVFWVCETEPGWKSLPRPQCDLGQNVAIAQIITDVLSDATLILAPFRLVYRVRLSRAQKIRIVSIFSTSAITTIVSLVHAYYVFTNGGLKEAMAALFETSISLIVANLSVVIAFLFRIGAEDSAAVVPKQLKSKLTFGSRPIRKKNVQHDPLQSTTMVGVDSMTLHMDDSVDPTKKPSDGSEAEALMPQSVPNPNPTSNV